MCPVSASQRITGVTSISGSHSILPSTATSASAWPATKSGRAGRQSSPRNSTRSPRARAIPALRAAAAPGIASVTTTSEHGPSQREARSRVRSREPLSTTTTSARTAPSSCSASAPSVQSGADYFLVLNNDTAIAPDAVRELVNEAERQPGAGVLCPLIYYMEPPDVIWFAGARFDPRRGHNGRHTGYGERDVGQYDCVRE